jgi:hypothetical protein
VCILEGTVWKVYNCPANVAGVSALGGWRERKVGVGMHLLVAPGGSTSAIRSATAVRETRVWEGECVPKGGDSCEQMELHIPVSSSPLHGHNLPDHAWV